MTKLRLGATISIHFPRSCVPQVHWLVEIAKGLSLAPTASVGTIFSECLVSLCPLVFLVPFLELTFSEPAKNSARDRDTRWPETIGL